MNIHRILCESMKKVLSEANESYQQKAAQYSKKGLELTPQRFSQICNADPTSNGTNAGKYFDWIYNNMKQINGLSFNTSEHWKRLPELLKLYNNNLKNLPVEDRNIMSMDYHTFSDMLGASSVGQKSYQTGVQQWKGQYDIVAQTDKWIGVHCKTWNCEKFFGQGAQWCTIGSQNYYNQYNSADKLVVCIPIENGMPNLRSRRKWQCDISKRSFHCADIKDHTYTSMKSFFKDYPDAYDKDFVMQLRKLDTRFYPMEGDEVPKEDNDIICAAAEELGVPSSSIFIDRYGEYVCLQPPEPFSFRIELEDVAYDLARESCMDCMSLEWINRDNIVYYLNTAYTPVRDYFLKRLVEHLANLLEVSYEKAEELAENPNSAYITAPTEEELAEQGISEEDWIDPEFGINFAAADEMESYGHYDVESYDDISFRLQNSDLEDYMRKFDISESDLYEEFGDDSDAINWDKVIDDQFDNSWDDPIEEWLGYGYGTYYFQFNGERYVAIHGDTISLRRGNGQNQSEYEQLCAEFHYTPQDHLEED